MWHGTDGMGWWMVFGSIWMVAVWGFVVWLFATIFGKTVGGSGKQDPIDIAKRRLASGEITKEQYEEILKTIRR